MFNAEDYHDITDVDLREFVMKCYSASAPQGMGMLHYTPGPLPDDVTDQILSINVSNPKIRLSMDYVLGRSIKMTVYKDQGKLYVRKAWYDHNESMLLQILEELRNA